jgi:hypothetical protein
VAEVVDDAIPVHVMVADDIARAHLLACVLLGNIGHMDEPWTDHEIRRADREAGVEPADDGRAVASRQARHAPPAVRGHVATTFRAEHGSR